ncbi:uncharacterized protein LOC124461953 [Drosophila willistoni]|uniref:uncharacterized protein LOC124461953 n=1 Tax=Drosophila willistoni TaxID=7260 RepID=UPI001F07CB8C|nr:uncharacterized protein LOC124461953 [Drosophila willistoni]
MLDGYLEKKIIRPSESEYASPIVLVPKKAGELRLCIDFRRLNKVLVKDNYPIPLIDDLLDKLGDKRFFSKLDLKDGYFHVFMEENSVKYTSFVTPLGQFEFLRMPMGLKNSSSVFQRFVNKIFTDMIRDNKVIVYQDDIMVASRTAEEHLDILKEVFRRIIRNKLELRIDKCEFFQSSIRYLGFIISEEGIRADDKGLEAVKNFPIPTNVHTTTNTKEAVLALKDYFRAYSRPFAIVSDRGSSFTSSEFEMFVTQNNVKHIKIATGSLKLMAKLRGISVDEFIYRAEAMTHQALEGNFVVLSRYVSNLFEENASEWFWRYHKKVSHIKWLDLCRALREQFKDERTDQHIKAAISKRRLGDKESFDEFYEAHELLYESIASVSKLRQLVRTRETFPQTVWKPLSLPPRSMPRRVVNAVSIQTEEESEAEDEVPVVEAVNLDCWNCDTAGHPYQEGVAERRVFCYGCRKPNMAMAV